MCCSSDDNSTVDLEPEIPVLSEFPVLSGPYLGQTPPGLSPKLFAADTILRSSIGLNHIRDIAITPDGQERYFSANNEGHSRSTINVIKIENGTWTEPVLASFSSNLSHSYGEPFMTSDGNRMYFISNKPLTIGRTDYNIWYVDREGDDWGTPNEIGSPINSRLNEFFPSLTDKETMYFTRTIPDDGTYIFKSKLVNGEYEEPEKLRNEINATNDQYNAFIAPHESYMIVPRWANNGSDYYISFRNSADDSWSTTIPFSAINSSSSKEWSASVSPDGKYLFFMSDRAPNPGISKIFWVDARIIRP